jgi:ADP-ribosylglycohydrolase
LVVVDETRRQYSSIYEIGFIKRGSSHMSNVNSLSEPEGVIARALFAYAAGDAFGVGYEFLTEPRIVDRINIVARGETMLWDSEPWPLGGVSDDTLLTQISIQALQSGKEGSDLTEEFLTLLRAAMPDLRGLGPTTRKALGLPLKGDEISNGRSNGAMMRTALLGAAFPRARDEHRRKAVRNLAVATHQDASAQFAAIVLSAAFSAAYEDPSARVDDVVSQESGFLVSSDFAADQEWIERVLTYVPPESGTSLDPLDTLGAVLHVSRNVENVEDSYYLACELGGDTDTVGALAGALSATRFRQGRLFDIPWFPQVHWSEVPRLQEYANVLEKMRG